MPGLYLTCSTDADYEVKRKFAGFSLGFVKMVKQLSLQWNPNYKVVSMFDLSLFNHYLNAKTCTICRENDFKSCKTTKNQVRKCPTTFSFVASFTAASVRRVNSYGIVWSDIYINNVPYVMKYVSIAYYWLRYFG